MTAPPINRDQRFVHLVRAEWTKLRTVRGWMVGLLIAAAAIIALGFTTVSGPTPCAGIPAADCVTVGPDGEAVTDHLYLVGQNLDGDGVLTARIASLTGMVPSFGEPDGQDPQQGMQPGVVPWAKAGLIVKASPAQGSSYVAVMVTGAHGVRMQDNFLNDVAGTLPGANWVRLSREGDVVTASESVDGTNWTPVGTARLAGSPGTVVTGMFVASPEYEVTSTQVVGFSSMGGPSQATGTFDQVTLTGGTGVSWTGGLVGGDGGLPGSGFTESAGSFAITGTGDIAPAVAEAGGNTVERGLIGVFAGLVLLVVVSTSFMTTEFRRGLIRTTFAASPRRGRVLAAKAVVMGGASFVLGLVTSAAAVFGIVGIRRSRGGVVLPVGMLTELRVVVGTAALMAVVALFALAVGSILRRSAATITTVIVLIVLPYLLAVASVLPVGAGQWALRLTPAAGFAIQQSTSEYAQVEAAYIPATGYFPLPPLAGFTVLCGWTVLALGLAFLLIQRRDA